MKQSVLSWLGLPGSFGVTLLILSLALTLAPWLGGYDFGALKIPDFPPAVRGRLRIIGPVALLVVFLLHLPGIPLSSPVASEGSRPSTESISAASRTPATEQRRSPIHVTMLEFYELKVGQPSAANAHYEVSAPSVRVSGNATLFVVTPRPGIRTDWDLALQEAWAQALARWQESGRELVVPEGRDMYFTTSGPQLVQSDVDGLLSGSSALFFAGRLKYSGDGSGAVEFCVLFKNGAKILCPEHNGPVN